MKLVIINYGAGNIQSIKFAFERLGVHAILSDDADEIKAADKVIFPGVGEASSAMAKLKATGLDKVIPTLKQPVLGICLGMQLLLDESDEQSRTEGLGFIKGKVRRIPDNINNPVPHVGWDNVIVEKEEVLL